MRLPRLIGHRGAAAAAPENTLASFREAARQGAAWVEFDAKLTADGAVVLFHDESLARTTGAAGSVRDRTLAELKKLDAGAWFSPVFTGERIPTLAEALRELDALGLSCNLEIKPCPGREAETAAAILAELSRLPPRGAALPLISSFSVTALRSVAAAKAGYPLALLLERRRPDWRDLALELGAVSVNIAEEEAAPDWIAEIKAAGLGILVYTVNHPSRAKRLFAAGADGVFTDAPALLRTAVPSAEGESRCAP